MTKNQFLEQNKDKRTKCQNFTRVMGYIRPTDSYNTGKKGEFNERVFFSENATCPCGK